MGRETCNIPLISGGVVKCDGTWECVDAFDLKVQSQEVLASAPPHGFFGTPDVVDHLSKEEPSNLIKLVCGPLECIKQLMEELADVVLLQRSRGPPSK